MSPTAAPPDRKRWAQAASLGARLAALSDDLGHAVEDLVAASAIEERFPDDGGTVVVITPRPWRWAPLSDTDLPKLSRARGLVQRWRRECVAAVRVIASEFESDLVDEMGALDSIVDRSAGSDGPMADTSEGVLHYADEARARQRETLRLAGIPLGASGVAETLLVPDTNGLYANPYLQEWEGVDPAVLVLVPQVSRELDKHKNESGESVRQKKAELVIRQFNEFARRGDTLSGVPIAGSLRYREEAIDVEPDAEDGLRVDNDDDRILASVLYVRRLHPQSGVVLVTRDQTLKAKARRYDVTTDEPPAARQDFKPRRTKRANPEVVLGHPSGQISRTPAAAPDESQSLAVVKPHYLIENKGATSVSHVTTGVRTRDGRVHRFEAYRAQLLAAGESSVVGEIGSIPPEFLDDVQEAAPFDAFLFWARFKDRENIEWEVVYDPASRETSWREVI